MKEWCKIKEVAGIASAVEGMRLPTKSKGDSELGIINSTCSKLNGGNTICDDGTFCLGKKDAKLAKTLLNKGNVHGKFQRGVIAWLDLNMPRYMWSELDTYQAGVAPTSSESTMYTLVKECRDITGFMFSESTPKLALWTFKFNLWLLSCKYKGRKNIPIEILKASLPEGWMQRRIKAFSYQALKGMYHSRRNHKLPEWQTICRAIEKLPFFEELLIGTTLKQYKAEGDK